MKLHIASYTDRDFPATLALWNETLPLDAMAADFFRSRILLDDNFDPALFLLAKEGSELRGFLLGFHAGRMPMGDADPQGRRGWILGLGVASGEALDAAGGMLLDDVEQRLRKLGKTECFVSTYPSAYITPGIDRKAYKGVLDLLLKRGYQVVKQALSMDAPLALFEVSKETAESEKQLLQSGIEIRVYRHSDLLRFLGFLEKSMPTDWVRVERRNLRLMGTGQFLPEQITVVTKEEEIIGYCQFEGAHFGPFGVADAFQGKGIGTVLLARTLERMRHLGLHNAFVMWTDDLAAKVYRKFGFTETRRFSILRKSLA